MVSSAYLRLLNFSQLSWFQLVIHPPRHLAWRTLHMAFIQFMRFSRQVYWGGLPLPPLVDHVLSELSAMAHPSWVALHGVAHSFIELRKPLHHDKAVIREGDPSCCWPVSNNTRTSPNGHYRNQIVTFFVAEDGGTIISQQKQDLELTVAHIIRLSQKNSALN